MKWVTIARNTYPSDGGAFLVAFTGSNILGQLPRLLNGSLELSSWDLRVWGCRIPESPEDSFGSWYKPSARAYSTYHVSTGAASFSCSELWLKREPLRANTEVAVQCSGAERVRATYAGQKSDLPGFYSMLGSLKYTGQAPPCPITWPEIGFLVISALPPNTNRPACGDSRRRMSSRPASSGWVRCFRRRRDPMA